MDLPNFKNALVKIVLSVKSEVVEKTAVKNVEQKSHQDYVTSLDYALEDYLIKTISKKFPEIEIFSEEQVKSPIDISSKNCIIIDPLDGTQNALSSIPYYSTSLAYLENGVPKIGITYDFVRDELFHASIGGGMFVNDTRIDGKNLLSNLDKKPINISNNFLSNFAESNPDLIRKIRNVAKIRMLAAQTLHLAYVASGRLRANFNYEAKLWDDAAGFVMLKEVGMEYVNFKGENIFPKQHLDPKENLMSMVGTSDDIKTFLNLGL